MASTGIQHDFLDPPKDSADHLGTLGHYRVISELGKGGMGYVFLAEDTRLKREIALKVMNQKIASTPGSRKRFISEARSMAAVHHDNVATIFEVGEHKGTPYMAMELLEGNTLENFREHHGEPDFHLLIAYARDIARGLAAAHAQGIVHRDIKPANIWLDTKTNRIKILDFGLALAQTPVDQLSGRGAVVGTPGYLSPEQARSEPLDDRSDLYSTGVVLYELATGALPLKSKTVAEQLIAILAHPPRPLRDRNDKIPQPLADLIHRLMAKEPRDRYFSAKDLEQALEKVEVECEKKTEVAQAINQLQLGLEQAVNKKNASSNDSAIALDVSQAMPNPFEMLPDVLPVATAAPGVGTSGVHAAVPMGSGPLASGSAGNRSASKKQSAKSSSASNSKVIWIVAGVAATALLLLIPAVVYFSAASAIARQQNQGTSIVGPREGDAKPGNAKPATNPASKGNAPKPKPPARQRAQQNQTPSKKTNSQSNSTTLITTASVKEVKTVTGEGVRWILSPKKNNGSFENSELTKDQKKIQGWTIKTSGSDAGWGKAENAKQPDGRTFAFAGSKSEIVLTSDPLAYKTKRGDVFRVGMNIGGDGQGTSDYQIVLGFQGDKNARVRYQLAKVTDGTKWRGKQRRLGYEYEVSDSSIGKKPFLEVTVSNTDPKRKRAMLDRVVVTVQSKQPATARPGTSRPGNARPGNARPGNARPGNASSPNSTSNTQPKPKPKQTPKPTPPIASSRTPASPPRSKPPSPGPSQPDIVRDVTLQTSDEKGADTTVKRGGGSKDVLGEKPMLVVQARNGQQIQHVYLRFPLSSLRPGGGQNANRNQRRGGAASKPKRLPVGTAELRLVITSAKRPSGATVRLYGLDQDVSDLWQEKKLAWTNSLSAKGFDALPLLAEQKVAPGDQTFTVSNPLLTKLVAESGHRSVTFILTASGGDEMVTFASKEDGGKPAPALILGMTE